MTFEEANEKLAPWEIDNGAVKAFGLKITLSICHNCEHKLSCRAKKFMPGEITKCNFFKNNYPTSKYTCVERG